MSKQHLRENLTSKSSGSDSPRQKIVRQLWPAISLWLAAYRANRAMEI
jgi:hypothetical protein